ncbi:MAG: glycosyltransferase family 9 protein [Chitinispirillaceae bacterium]
MNILLLRFSSMGDVILVSPVLTYLKTQYPEASITFVTSGVYSSLFRSDPRVSFLIGVEKKQKSVQLSGPYDLVVDLQNNSRSKRFLKSSGITNVTGSLNKFHLKRLLLLYLRLNFYPEYSSVPVRYLNAAGFQADEIPPVKLHFDSEPPSEFRNWVEKRGVMRPVVALFPFSAWKNKQWPGEYFIKVGRYFSAKGWNVLLMGGSEDVQESYEIHREIGSQCLSLVGELSLDECGRVLKNCSLALGNDTGLSHLARSCQVRTGIIYGPTTSHFGFYPYGIPPFRVFEEKLWCRPCHPHGGNRCPLGHWHCMKKLLPEMVIEGMEDLSGFEKETHVSG